MAISFINSSADGTHTIIKQALETALVKKQRVLWVITGGSGIKIVVKVMSEISDEASKQLAVLLGDERFGPVNHKDSNLRQLYEAGFDAKHAIVVPVLRPKTNLEETVKRYGEAAETAFTAAGTVIAQLGMGADGHIAGVLPESPATKLSKQWTVGYKAKDFTRLTLTPFALQRANQIYVAAFGKAKRTALSNLRDKQLSIAEQPAQLVKAVEKSYIINDQLGDV
ncbi:MAG TPA: 6-phosphogluconolactonase [Candidatus Saccharimonadales bacterium]|nr:6-phosphogluconolactonase [Candidatus Saccharimonadales bacterium]